MKKKEHEKKKREGKKRKQKRNKGVFLRKKIKSKTRCIPMDVSQIESIINYLNSKDLYDKYVY